MDDASNKRPSLNSGPLSLFPLILLVLVLVIIISFLILILSQFLPYPPKAHGERLTACVSFRVRRRLASDDPFLMPMAQKPWLSERNPSSLMASAAASSRSRMRGRRP